MGIKELLKEYFFNLLQEYKMNIDRSLVSINQNSDQMIKKAEERFKTFMKVATITNNNIVCFQQLSIRGLFYTRMDDREVLKCEFCGCVVKISVNPASQDGAACFSDLVLSKISMKDYKSINSVHSADCPIGEAAYYNQNGKLICNLLINLGRKQTMCVNNIIRRAAKANAITCLDELTKNGLYYDDCKESFDCIGCGFSHKYDDTRGIREFLQSVINSHKVANHDCKVDGNVPDEQWINDSNKWLVSTNKRPRHPDFEDERERMISLYTYPGVDDLCSREKLESFSKAGYFYDIRHEVIDQALKFDTCRHHINCFYCDMAVSLLSVDDNSLESDPFVIHGRRSPNCPFFIENTDQEFRCHLKDTMVNDGGGNIFNFDSINTALRVAMDQNENSDLDIQQVIIASTSNITNTEREFLTTIDEDFTELQMNDNSGNTYGAIGHIGGEVNVPVEQGLDNPDDIIGAFLARVQNVPELRQISEPDERLLPEVAASSNSSRASVPSKKEMRKNTESSQEVMAGANSSIPAIDGVKQKNEVLKSMTKCIICDERNACILFLPCNDMVTCENCSSIVEDCPRVGCGLSISNRIKMNLVDS